MKKEILIILFIVLFAPFTLRASETKPTPIKILLVPGHDNEVWGSQYGNIKEADMNLVLANQIFNTLKNDKNFKVYITRDKNGYTKEFSEYFLNKKEDILLFKENAKKKTKENILNGGFIQKINVPHVLVNSEMSLRLYGINKWASENKIDVVIHVHFNDYPRKNKWVKGKYKGFSIYVPEGQMANSSLSLSLAKDIFSQLSKKYAKSTYEKESNGIIPDQSLIALGSNNSLIESTRSVLIEYGYIYRFGDSVMRRKSYKTMSDLTVKGVKDYFYSIN
jgi:N-acetylmuramoyl-L-alanine amidase